MTAPRLSPRTVKDSFPVAPPVALPSVFSLDPRRLFVWGRHIRALSHLVRAMHDVGRAVIVTTDKHGTLHFSTQERGA